ncbi:MAG: SDR family oxidoreductase [Treponema sp.]|jgi:NAD(P)-dependent dehydrogenase (short-subunit alcohol dehydrogenase family)|nr:SDR family oxidoreductase [Treponema sp.]
MPHKEFSDEFSGRTALVTGAARGLGKAIAGVLLEQGARVVAADLLEDALDKTAAELSEKAPGSVWKRVLDVRDEKAVQGLFEWASRDDTIGTIDVLVNNAGVCYAHPFIEQDEAAYEDTFAVNVYGVLTVSRIFASYLIARKQGGNIVNLSSNAYRRPYAYFVEYNASKAAVANITHTLSQELAPYGINVNAVAPGAADTHMLRYSMERTIALDGGGVDVEECRKTWGPRQLRRLVDPREVGLVAAFLASERARIVRGQTIFVDGGDTAL